MICKDRRDWIWRLKKSSVMIFAGLLLGISVIFTDNHPAVAQTVTQQQLSSANDEELFNLLGRLNARLIALETYNGEECSIHTGTSYYYICRHYWTVLQTNIYLIAQELKYRGYE